MKKAEKKNSNVMPHALRLTNEELNAQIFETANRQLEELAEGQTEQLNFKEALHLYWQGREEGKKGLIRCENDSWGSPFLKKEGDAYREYCKKVWGDEHIYLERVHSQCEPLLSDISRQEEHLAEVKAKYKPSDPSFFLSRKLGEEKLSDSQVRSRRQREENARLQKIKAEAGAIEAAMASDYERLSMIYSYITASEAAARLICERVLSHIRQRMEVYWKAALVASADRDKMPVSPTLPEDKEAEQLYMVPYRELKETVSAFLERRSREFGGHQAEPFGMKEVA